MIIPTLAKTGLLSGGPHTASTSRPAGRSTRRVSASARAASTIPVTASVETSRMPFVRAACLVSIP
jgi:hypothetical protein